jgi:crotonobetainyl-CoA:carnitine CoA-transferase CaiB-like acyl-CoA transferase
MNQGPMSGIRVIDLTIAAAGPLSTAILASQGAEVIKVERPDGGDFMRTMGARSKGVTATFSSWNRGKQSICIDLKQPAGAALLKKLVSTADVIVHNLRPGNAEELGIGYEDLRDVKPDLIYAYLTGWGEKGPRAGEPAYDSVIQAASGIAASQADPVTGAPQFVSNALCDKTSGIVLSQMITAALFSRERTGQGQRVHLSMLHTALSFIWPDAMYPVTFMDETSDLGKAVMPPVRQTLDGWMSLSCNRDNEFQELCKVLDLADLANDPRFIHNSERSRNSDSLWTRVNPVLRRRRTADLVAAFTAQRIPHSVVNTPETIISDSQVSAIGALEVLQHPIAGRLRLVRPPGDFSATPLVSPSLAPQLGEQTDQLLAAMGLPATEIAALRAAGTVA